MRLTCGASRTCALRIGALRTGSVRQRMARLHVAAATSRKGCGSNRKTAYRIRLSVITINCGAAVPAVLASGRIVFDQHDDNVQWWRRLEAREGLSWLRACSMRRELVYGLASMGST